MARAIGPAAGLGLILGVTRELSVLSSRLCAVDNNVAMVESARASFPPPHRVYQADWRDLSFLSEKFSFAVGDGSFNMLRQNDYKTVLSQLADVLDARAPLVLRLYASPETPETADKVAACAAKGEIGTFNAFKWRLAMAVAAENRHMDVAVTDIRDAFNRACPDREALARDTGWTMQDINTIDVYAGSSIYYRFPTLVGFSQEVRAAGWAIESHTHGDYELAERCPILVLRQSPNA